MGKYVQDDAGGPRTASDPIERRTVTFLRSPRSEAAAAPAPRADAGPPAASPWPAIGFGVAALLVGYVRLRHKGFDLALEHAVNAVAGRSKPFDLAFSTLDRFNAFQGVAVFSLACAAFFTCGLQGRLRLVTGCLAASASAAISRLIQVFVPSNPRPMFDPDLRFVPPFGANGEALRDWSSYPSDHAALLFGIGCAILLVHRRLGAAALCVAAIDVVARAYEGEHYPNDLLGGALLAATCVFAVGALNLSRLRPLADLAARHAAVFAGLAFFVAVEAAYMFDDARHLAVGILKQLH